jgi:hypothetical protein
VAHLESKGMHVNVHRFKHVFYCCFAVVGHMLYFLLHFSVIPIYSWDKIHRTDLTFFLS